MKEKSGKEFLIDNWITILWGMVLFCFMIMELIDFKPESLVTYSHNVGASSIVSLSPGNDVIQAIDCETNEFQGIDVRYNITDGALDNDSISVSITDEDNNELGYYTNTLEYLKKHLAKRYFLDKPLKNMKGKQIRVAISVQSNAVNTGAGVWCNGDASITQVYNTSIESDYYCIRMVQPIVSGNMIKILVSICGMGVLILAMFIGTRRKWKEEKRYLLLAGVVSILFLVMIPPSKCPDESVHLLRIFEIAQGNMISEETADGGNTRIMPGNIGTISQNNARYSDYLTDINRSLDYENLGEYHFPTAALYSPISCFFQVIGVTVFKFFTNKVYFIAWGGKLVGMLGSLLLLFYGIKLIPIKKKVLVAS